MRKTFEGLNAEHLLVPPKPRRKITKWTDDKGNFFTHIKGEDVVDMRFQTFSINEQGFRRDFMKSKLISLKEFKGLSNE